MITPISVKKLVDLAFQEDLLFGDPSSEGSIPLSTWGTAIIRAKSDLVLSGQEAAQEVFSRFDDITDIKWFKIDGDTCSKGEHVVQLSGLLRDLLMAERTALNFLMRLSGIATHAKAVMDCIRTYPNMRITDTRKTMPGWRYLEKKAVRDGGAFNHRFNLSDGIMLKENHIMAAGGIAKAVERVRAHTHHLQKIEVETTNLDEVSQALEAKADVIMLDNMSNQMTSEAITLIRGHSHGPHVTIEASGNMTLARLPEVAALGVDVVSMGALTHSSIAADLSMRVTAVGDQIFSQPKV